MWGGDGIVASLGMWRNKPYGLIIEVHNDPIHALCDGAQSLRPEQYDDLAKAVRRVREAVSQ